MFALSSRVKDTRKSPSFSPGISKVTAFMFATLWLSILETRSAQARQVASMQELTQSWSTSNQLYVQGQVGLSAAAIQDLANWLTSHPNWTVVLVADATRESYRDADGNRYQGYAAVEHALGKEISNKVEFQNLTNTSINKPNGAILVIAFQPRKVGYFGSDAQAAYGLDNEQAWTGNLDQYAIRPLKQGRQVARAVKDTISEIDGRMSRAIKAEGQQQERIEREAKLAVTQARTQFEELGGLLSDFREKYPDLKGTIPYPETAQASTLIERAEGALEQKDYPGAVRESEEASDRISKMMKALSLYPEFDSRIDSLSDRIEKALEHPYANQHQPAITTARSTIEEARHLWSTGDESYLSSFQLAERQVEGVERELRNSALAAEKTKYVIGGLGSLFGLALMTGGLIANRRRKPVRDRAMILYKRWEKLLTEKLDPILELSTMRERVLGPDFMNYQQHYHDESEACAETAVLGLNKLIVMHSEAEKILSSCQDLIFPKNLSAATNLISTKNYQKAIDTLENDSISFEPGSELDLMFNGELQDRSIFDRLEAFKMKFHELMRQFEDQERKIRAGLIRVRDASHESALLLEQIRGGSDEITRFCAEIETITGAARGAGLKEAATQFQNSTTSAIAGYETRLEKNPVGVLAPLSAIGDVVKSSRKALRKTATQLQEQWPLLEESQLELGDKAAWFQPSLASDLEELSRLLHRLGQSTGKEEATSGIEKFVATAKSVRSHASSLMAARSLWQGCEGLERDLKQAALTLKECRSTLSTRSGLSEERLLKEENANPDTFLDASKRHLNETKNQLELGKVEKSRRSFAKSREAMAGANGIVERTKVAFQHFQPREKKLISVKHSQGEKRTQHDEILKSMTDRYREEVFAIANDDAEGYGTVANNITEVDEATTKQANKLSEAKACFERGAFLQAMDDLDCVEYLNKFIEYRYKEIVDKKQSVEKAERENEKTFATLQERSGKIEQSVDGRTSQATLDGLAVIQSEFSILSQAASYREDPFLTQVKLDESSQEVLRLEQAQASDQEAFQRLTTEMERMKKQLAEVGQLMARAQGDDIPDSVDLKQAYKEHRQATEEYEAMATRQSQPHLDWQQLEESIAEMLDGITELHASFEGELDRGKAARQSIQSARRKVREAENWSGRYGITISGSPGSHQLNRASDAFDRGDYDKVTNYAEKAKQQAQTGINHAEERLRKEEKRRERQRASSRSFYNSSSASSSSWSSGSSSSFGGSSWGSSSGFSSSSFGGGGSGFSSSSW